MAMMNCPECGKEISDKAYVCPNCGFLLKEIGKYGYVKKKIPGKGLGIAGMVLGIIGVVYSPILIIPIITFSIFKQEITASAAGQSRTDLFGISIEIALLGILALVFGLISRHKGYKTGKSVSSIVMGLITIFFSLVAIILNIIIT